MKKKLIAIAGAVVLLVSLAGCASPSTDSPKYAAYVLACTQAGGNVNDRGGNTTTDPKWECVFIYPHLPKH